MNRWIAASALIMSMSAALAAPVTPTFTVFGPLSGATFGGSGIPNDRVAQTTTVASGVTIALSATPRFGGPAVSDNGAGVYTVQAGASTVAPSPANPYALWNFNFYVGDTAAIDDLGFRLFWDFDPAAGTDQASLGVIGFNCLGLPNNLGQNSWNLGMDFLASNAFGVVPPAGVFDPNATGQYSFLLAAYETTGAGQVELGRVAIHVNVVAPGSVPEPGTMALAGLALLATLPALRLRARSVASPRRLRIGGPYPR